MTSDHSWEIGNTARQKNNRIGTFTLKLFPVLAINDKTSLSTSSFMDPLLTHSEGAERGGRMWVDDFFNLKFTNFVNMHYKRKTHFSVH